MKISFSARAFVAYFLILAVLSWFFIDQATDKLRVAFQQSSETVLVDTANLLATSLEQNFHDGVLDTDEISQLFEQSYDRQIHAQIYSLTKEAIDLEIYITDNQGTVVYDSTHQHTGDDFSSWLDVKRTLNHEYGARSSTRYSYKTAPGDEKIMVVAAPIRSGQSIAGVLSVVKPVQPLEQLLATESKHLTSYLLIALAIAIAIAYFISLGFTQSIRKIVTYANNMAAGQRSPQPAFMDKRFDALIEAITHLRQELDGKEYVEHYVHALTHELKTPLTAVAAASELLNEDMPASDQKHFIGNIQSANQRMQLLVDRILELSKLESLNALNKITTFDLSEAIRQQLSQSTALIQKADCHIEFKQQNEMIMVNGDPLLIRQCIGNLLDNAIENSPNGSKISIEYQQTHTHHQLQITNQGRLDDYVLARAFERFFSAQSKKGLRKRTGLGLSFCREIMQLHQGNIQLLNTNDGVCAQIKWPMALQT